MSSGRDLEEVDEVNLDALPVRAMVAGGSSLPPSALLLTPMFEAPECLDETAEDEPAERPLLDEPTAMRTLAAD